MKWLFRLAALLLTSVLIAASGRVMESGRASASTLASRLSAPAASLPESHPSALYTNPVYDQDFPDPFVLEYGGRFYAYATHSHGFGFQGLESRDLVHWTHRGTVFTVPWSRENYWAPEVVRRDGRFYMTYSARNPKTGKHDIGIATAETPLGPFVDRATLARGDDNRVGVIDATIFIEADGMPYLIYAEEEPRRIVLRRMTRDLMRVEGDPIELVRPDRPSEHDVTEAPTLIRRGGTYHLFFSVGRYESNQSDASYAVCHAIARSLRGPYRKDLAPLLKTVPGAVFNPGHQCVFRLQCGEWWIGYHGWDEQNEPRYGSNPAGRTLRIDRLRWKGGVPVVDGPTTTPQPAPCTRVRAVPRRSLLPGSVPAAGRRRSRAVRVSAAVSSLSDEALRRGRVNQSRNGGSVLRLASGPGRAPERPFSRSRRSRLSPEGGRKQ